MKILLIPYCFAPVQVPQTYVLLKWCKYLTEGGHQLTVLCVDPDTQCAHQDPGLLRLVPQGIEEVRVNSPENTLPYRILRKAARWLLPLFQPWKREWYGAARNSLRNLPLSEYDVVLSTSQPPVCHLVAWQVKKKAGIPWVAYFSDPWVDGPYRQDLSKRIQKYNQNWESRVIGAADLLIFPTEEMKSLVLRKYPQDAARKARTLDHCFVPDWFNLAPPQRREHNGTRRLVSTGNFYGPRTVEPLIRAVAGCKEKLLGHVGFDFFGNMGATALESPMWRSLDGLLKSHGRVDYLTSLAECRSAHALVLIDAPADTHESSIFFPSKLAEYLGSGRPIIGLTPLNGSSARILRETKNVAFDPYDSGAVGELLTRIAEGRAAFATDEGSREKYNYRAVGRQLVAILEEACGRRRGH